jgi:hypothetical protein
MNDSKYKLLVIWNVILSTLLLLAIGVAAAGVQAANDPPVQVFSATLDHGVGVTGNATANNVTLDTTSWKPILSVPVNFAGQAHNHQCIVVASANLENPTSNTTGHRYDFSLAIDGSTSLWSLMQVEMSDNASVDDANFVPVSTNRIFTDMSPAAHTLNFVGRKEAAGSPSLVVTNSSVSVICVKKLQTLLNIADPGGFPVESANDK